MADWQLVALTLLSLVSSIQGLICNISVISGIDKVDPKTGYYNCRPGYLPSKPYDVANCKLIFWEGNCVRCSLTGSAISQNSTGFYTHGGVWAASVTSRSVYCVGGKATSNEGVKLAGSCPRGWKVYEGSCLWFSRNKLSFHDASINCGQLEGSIVQTKGEGIDIFLSQNLIGEAWIDVRDASLSNWFPGIPQYGTCIAKYHGPLSPNHGKWYSEGCQSKRQYICQITLQPEDCPKSTKWVQGKCLWTLPGKNTFIDGSESCKQLGGSIVQIDNDAKDLAVTTLMESETWIDIARASRSNWLLAKPANPECIVKNFHEGTIHHGKWYPLGCHYFRTVLCEKRPDVVQRIASTTTRDGLILKYRKYPNYDLPTSAKCPRTMIGNEVCEKHSYHEECKLYCQPKKNPNTKSSFEMEILQQTKYFDTMVIVAPHRNIWVFSYIYPQSPPRAADINVCISLLNGIHTTILGRGDYTSPSTQNLADFVRQFPATEFNLYESVINYNTYRSRGALNVRLPTAILCYGNCERYDAGSEITSVDEYGYYRCKGTKVPMVPHARAACRRKTWYGDCMDRPIGSYANVSILWSSGYYTCKNGSVPSHPTCTSLPQTTNTLILFDASCITPAEFNNRNGRSGHSGCIPPVVAPILDG